MTSWRGVIKVHSAAELFPLMGSEELRELGEDIKANGMKMPIILLQQDCGLSLIDGRNRLDALEVVGCDVPALFQACLEGKPRPELWVEYVAEPGVDSGLTDRNADPYAYVISTNLRRRHLTAAQKGELIAVLLKANPERSDRAIAEIAKVDHEKVGTARKQLESTGDVPPVGKRIGRDGKARKPPTQPANPHRPAVTDAKFEDIRTPQTSADDPAPTKTQSAERTGASPQLTTAAPWSAALAPGSEPAAPLPDTPITYVPPPSEPPLSVPSTGEIPQPTGDGLVSETLGDDPQPDEPAEPRLEVVKRLIRELPVGELEAFKQWFREYAGAAIVSQSAPEATPAKRGRGRPKGSTVANGARPPTLKLKQGMRTEAPAGASESEEMEPARYHGR
jgi:hypothetical protein